MIFNLRSYNVTTLKEIEREESEPTSSSISSLSRLPCAPTQHLSSVCHGDVVRGWLRGCGDGWEGYIGGEGLEMIADLSRTVSGWLSGPSHGGETEGGAE